MSGWIKFWKDMPNDPRVLAAAAKLAGRYILAQRGKGGCEDLPASEAIALCRNAVTGALATLWAYADEHIHDDDSLPLTSQTIDAVVGIEGFFDLLPRDWIDELDDGSIILPGYCEKNSLIAKRKRTIKSNARVTQWRRAKKSNGNGVTTQHATQYSSAGDLDQDSDRDQDKNRKEESTKVAQRPLRADPPEFLQFKATYPHRAGSQPWPRALQAITARLREGHSWQEILDGASRYAEFCLATGKVATEHVQQAARFCGPGKEFLQRWSLPATKSEIRLSGNLSAAEEFMRRTEGTQ